MIPIPEELLEQFERGNALLFIGERVTRDAEGQAVIDRLVAQLAARCNATDEGELSFPEVAQAYEDEKGLQALAQFLRDQLEELGDEPQQAHRLIAGLTDIVTVPSLESAVRARVPRGTEDPNLKAFRAGLELSEGLRG